MIDRYIYICIYICIYGICFCFSIESKVLVARVQLAGGDPSKQQQVSALVMLFEYTVIIYIYIYIHADCGYVCQVCSGIVSIILIFIFVIVS